MPVPALPEPRELRAKQGRNPGLRPCGRGAARGRESHRHGGATRLSCSLNSAIRQDRWVAGTGAALLPGDSGTVWRQIPVITAGGVRARSTQRVEMGGLLCDILQSTGPPPRRETQPRRSTAAGLRSRAPSRSHDGETRGPIRAQVPGAPAFPPDSQQGNPPAAGMSSKILRSVPQANEATRITAVSP